MTKLIKVLGIGIGTLAIGATVPVVPQEMTFVQAFDYHCLTEKPAETATSTTLQKDEYTPDCNRTIEYTAVFVDSNGQKHFVDISEARFNSMLGKDGAKNNPKRDEYQSLLELTTAKANAAVARTTHVNLTNASGSSTNTIAVDATGASSLVAYSENSVNTANDTTGATYNGTSMTEFARIARPGQNREIVGWYLHNPDTGTNNLVVTRSTASGRFVASAFGYSGTDTSASYSTGDGYAEELNGTASSVTLQFSNDGGEAVSAVGVFGSGSQAGSTDTTLVSSFDIISDFEATTLPGTANDAIVATFASDGYGILGIALKEAQVAAPDISQWW